MKQFIIPILCMLLIGCNETDSTEKSRTIADQEKKIKELERQLEEKEASQDPRDTRNPNYDVYKDPDLVQIDLGKFVFAIIKTQDKRSKVSYSESGKPMPGEEAYDVTDVSGIHRIELYSDEKKAKFKDLVKSKAAMTRYWNPKIYSVEVKEFSSYTEASEAREKIDYKKEVLLTLPKNF